MIRFEVSGSNVRITMTGPYPVQDTTFHFEGSTPAPWVAKMLWRLLDTAIRERLHKIREVAYNNGWKDAKAKSAKQNYFDYGWDDA